MCFLGLAITTLTLNFESVSNFVFELSLCIASNSVCLRVNLTSNKKLCDLVATYMVYNFS